jgi:hypothetical protein
MSDERKLMPDIAPAKTKRECGSCSLCCYLLEVKSLKEPQGEWCEHCRPGHGCAIYKSRPMACRNWSCAWMTDDSWGDEWFPDHATIVINYNNKMPSLDFIVDPKFSHRWKEEPYFTRMNQVALARDRKGLITRVILGGGFVIAVLPLPAWCS